MASLLIISAPRLSAGRRPDGGRRPSAGVVLRERNQQSTALRRSSAITEYPKDGINDHVITGANTGEPGPAWHQGVLVRTRSPFPPGARLSYVSGCIAEIRTASWRTMPSMAATSTQWWQTAKREADDFYAAAGASTETGEEEMRVPAPVVRGSRSGASRCIRTGCSRWLDGDPGQPPPPPGHRSGRNSGLATP